MNPEKSLEFYIDRYFKNFPDSKINIIERIGNFIYFETEFGLCKNHFNNFGRRNYSRKGAVNKTEFFINELIHIHNNKYDYSLVDYKNNSTKITVICPLHGEFFITPAQHLKGCGCPKCANNKRQEFNSKNPTGWTLTNWVKAAEKSKKFDSFKVYIIECWNEEERFFKIGRTFLKVKSRFFCKELMPYKYKIVKEIIGEAEEIYKLEQKLKNMNKKNKYKPRIDFKGKYECFMEIKLDNKL